MKFLGFIEEHHISHCIIYFQFASYITNYIAVEMYMGMIVVIDLKLFESYYQQSSLKCGYDFAIYSDCKVDMKYMRDDIHNLIYSEVTEDK